MYDIDPEVPMPFAPPRGGRPNKYPFPKMKVGDSFKIGSDIADAERVRGAMKSFSKNHDVKFSVRKAADGYRCWRTV